MSDNSVKKKAFLLGILISVIFCASFSKVFASETNGTIDSTYKYAWGENIGWINFGCDRCNVSITDGNISGYAWSTRFGWINLNPDRAGVKNTANGALSGSAWSSNLGWIDFTGVTIDTSGEFSGYAVLQSDNSRINFNCADGGSCGAANFKVKTDWRPVSVRSTGGGGGGGRICIPPQVLINNVCAIPPPPAPNPIVSIANNIGETANSAYDFILDFLNLKKELEKNIIVTVPKIAPLSFKTEWNLLPVRAINSFVFAPLPYEVRILASKFPELDKTLKSVGVERFSDLNKMTGVTLNIPGLADTLNKTIKNVGLERLTDINKINGVTLGIPGLSDISGTMMNSVGVGKIALISGLPIDKFPLIAKKNLATEFVFARTGGELVDLNVAMSIGDKGEVTQQISSLPGKTLRLVVKPISKAKSVTGYFVFKSATPKITQAKISRATLTASALFSMNDLVEKNPEPISAESKLVLSSFEYVDPDKDGIYTADVVSPVVPGEYEVITVIDYIDPVLGTRQMRMITVVDPEGYVFEKNNGKETRIPSAIVSLYYLNTATKKYELWPAKDYQQENPQITDVRGTYSFLVPEGSYYFEVVAPGYDTYQGKVFLVTEGSGIHQNIELKSGLNLLSNFDWKTALLIVVLLLLVYNLSKDKLSKVFKRS